MKLNTLLHHALGIALLVMCSTAILATEAKKPNVMIIFADDVGTGDVPGYWQDTSEVNMVNLSRLVADGVTFTDAHSTPVCAPSRYMLLSGNYQHRGEFFSGTWSLNHSGNQFRHGQKSIAQIFRDNGYRTSMYGKWHLGGEVTLLCLQCYQYFITFSCY
jgi:arylsulfatase A